MVHAIAVFLLLADPGDGLTSWIEQLGSDDIGRRDEASASLLAAGERAVPALLKAKDSPDVEARSRIADLLKRSWATRPSPSLDLSLDEPKHAPKGVHTFTLRARNIARVPVVVHGPGIRLAGFSVTKPAPDRFTLLEPGETLRVELEGEPLGKNTPLIPFYCDPREAFASPPSVRMFQVRHAEVLGTARLLHDLFMPQIGAPDARRDSGAMDVAVDLCARTIVVRGPEEWLDIAKEVLSELDPPPGLVHTSVVPLAQTPAEELAQRLQRLLRRTTPEGK